MKKLITLIALSLTLIFGGCSSVGTPQEFSSAAGVSVSSNQEEINKCYEWMKEKEAAERQQYEALSKEDKAYALMHRDTMSMIKSVWGKESEVCRPGTNGWDAYIVAKKEEEITKRQYSSDLKSVATFGIVTTGAVKLADSVMGRVGDKISASDNAQVSVNKEDNDTVALANDKSKAEISKSDSGKSDKTSSCEIDQMQLTDCRTTTVGPATPDEYNACLTKDYGHSSEEIANCPQ